MTQLFESVADAGRQHLSRIVFKTDVAAVGGDVGDAVQLGQAVDELLQVVAAGDGLGELEIELSGGEEGGR
jgi:hypothetical protein